MLAVSPPNHVLSARSIRCVPPHICYHFLVDFPATVARLATAVLSLPYAIWQPVLGWACRRLVRPG